MSLSGALLPPLLLPAVVPGQRIVAAVGAVIGCQMPSRWWRQGCWKGSGQAMVLLISWRFLCV